ncbi:angiopoietin-1-like [Chanos chanos]|uniref:Angiopoietin-1-like n=1 Tax=Chanos chanos TaxID=29144 RepID=A0A6J2W4D9_CHACN|nr:angiopoietin-1-like [Chanos chanos]
MMWRNSFWNLLLLWLSMVPFRAFAVENSPVETLTGNSVGGSGRVTRRYDSVQRGECTYTFILPENDGTKTACWPGRGDKRYYGNGFQRDVSQEKQSLYSQRIQHLEVAMENNTQWLQRIEGYVKESLQAGMNQLQHDAVQNHTAAILDLGTSILSQTAHHTRRLTDMETQVLNQTSRLEIQLLENSLSTNKLETQLLRQTTEISKLYEQNRLLEQRMQEMEARHRQELANLKAERAELQGLLANQSTVIQNLELSLEQTTNNCTALQNQQLLLQDAVASLVKLCSRDKDKAVIPTTLKQADEQRKFRDCADLFRAGFNRSGVYTIHITMEDTKKVYCNMESAGGGWTVIQNRKDGTLDFHRTWKEYKMGFGTPSGEHWLGNEFVFQLTNQRQYTLRVELTDWDGQHVFSQYDRFQIASEKRNYRLFLRSHSGTAGRQSSLVINGADFSTKDVDNDNCICKCALMLTGGWWFDACGPSNLNGMYYTYGQNTGKLNGIKWHYFKGSSYSLRATAMMIRPLDF